MAHPLQLRLLCSFALLCPVAAVEAQVPYVSANVMDWSGDGQTHTTRKENTTTWVQVSGLGGNGQPFDSRCEAKTVCQVPEGATGVSSRLVYDNGREKLTKCNGLAPTSDGASCESAGLIKAELQVRLGKLKLIPQKADGISSWAITTVGAGVTLQFSESSEDTWRKSYKTTGVNFVPDYSTVPAGSYKIFADDLLKSCKPTQTNDGVTVSVPEGGQSEVTIIFTPTDCTLTVRRSDEDDSGAHGTVTSDPAGLTCDADPNKACVGTFPFGTTVALTPVPSAGYKESWVFAECSVSSGTCTKTIQSDREFKLSFYEPDAPVDPEPGEPDAGQSAEPDAGQNTELDASQGAEPEDGSSGTPDASQDGELEGDGAQPEDEANGALDGGEDASDNTADSSGSSENSGCSTSRGQGGSGLGLVLLALFYIVRRRRHT